MLDLKGKVFLNLDKARAMAAGKTYIDSQPPISRDFVVKLITQTEDLMDERFVSEFNKMSRLSSEPEIASVFFGDCGIRGQNPELLCRRLYRRHGH